MNSFQKHLVFLSIFIFLSACGSDKVESTDIKHSEPETSVTLTEEQYKTTKITLGEIEKKAMSGSLRVSGILDVPPQNLVSISSLFGGTVKSTTLLQGMKIKKGQVVAMIQNPEFITMQQDYLDYKSQMEYLKLEYERQQELAEVNAKKMVQKAKSEYESMRARVNGLKSQLQLMNISIQNLENGTISNSAPLYSPINGYVIKVNTNIGAYVTPSDVLFEIADTEHLHVELTVFESDVSKIKTGQKVSFKLANENEERSAFVYLIGKEIDSDRTVKIHCHLTKTDTELLPGMYLTAFIEMDKTISNTLPENSIVEFEGQQYIFEEVNNTKPGEHLFKMILVKTGQTNEGFTAIELPSGYDLTNAKIVIKGAYDLLSKLKNAEEEE